MSTKTRDQRTIVPGLYEDAWQHDGFYGEFIGANPRLRTSSQDGETEALKDGQLFTMANTYSMGNTESIAFNFVPLENVIVLSAGVVGNVSTVKIAAYNADATGTAQSYVEPINRNLCSNEFHETFAKDFTAATAVGDIIAVDENDLIFPVISCVDKAFSIVWSRNDVGSAEDVTLFCKFQILGRNNPNPAVPWIGLIATTFLQASTEMSTYG